MGMKIVSTVIANQNFVYSGLVYISYEQRASMSIASWSTGMHFYNDEKHLYFASLRLAQGYNLQNTEHAKEVSGMQKQTSV